MYSTNVINNTITTKYIELKL